MRLANVSGMNVNTGQWLRGVDHIAQSILDVLTTSPGTIVCNRDYGSDLPNLIDAPLNDAGVQALYAATAVAVAIHYPFVTLTQIAVEQGDQAGSISLGLTGVEAGSELAEPFTLSLSLPLPVPTLN